MTKLEELQSCKSLADLATILGYKSHTMAYILYKLPDEQKYLEFEIPKKTGGRRKILAPHPKLKLLQKRLADYLLRCYQETYLSSEKYKKPLAFGFCPNLSIFDNATNHKNRKYVLNVDLQDFFLSINFGRVRGFFIKNKYFNLDPKIATLIAQTCCHNNYLPQGSPCSPIISNFIATQLDSRLVVLARGSKCTYSRYADDLTFSTNIREFPEEIAKNEQDHIGLGKELVKIIKDCGFLINQKKVSLQFKRSRQMATGLVVNKKVNVLSDYYRKARSMCSELFKTDIYYLDTEKSSVPISKLLGIVNFIYWVKVGRRYTKQRDNKKSSKLLECVGIEKLYKKLIIYNYFVNPSKPVILTEGKTDRIYLKCALQSFAFLGRYPELLRRTPGSLEKFEFTCNFVNTGNKTFQDLFYLPGGTSGLVSLCDDLIDLFKKEIYTSPLAFKKPIIIVVDNDRDGGRVFNKVKQNNDKNIITLSRIEVACFKKFLYVVKIPKLDAKRARVIEELFPHGILNTKLDGKSFNYTETPENKLDPNAEYGKSVFANNIVKQQWKKINFSEFEPLLEEVSRIVSIR